MSIFYDFMAISDDLYRKGSTTLKTLEACKENVYELWRNWRWIYWWCKKSTELVNHTAMHSFIYLIRFKVPGLWDNTKQYDGIDFSFFH